MPSVLAIIGSLVQLQQHFLISASATHLEILVIGMDHIFYTEVVLGGVGISEAGVLVQMVQTPEPCVSFNLLRGV